MAQDQGSALRRVLRGIFSNQVLRTDEGRPMVLNPSGSVSTERTVTIQDPRINEGRPTNIPTLFGGVEVDPREAIELVAMSGGIDPETGRELPSFENIDEALRSARSRSRELGQQVQQRSPISQDPLVEALRRSP